MDRLFAGLLCVGLLAACGDGKADAVKQMEAADSTATTAAVDLAAHGLPLELFAPDPSLTGGLPPVVAFNENTGQLEVRAGDRFALTITEDVGDIARLKADLDRDLLRRNTVVSETPDRVVYRSEFPDEALVFLHFYRVVEADGRSFVVEDIQEGVALNEQDVERMVDAVRPKQPV